MNPEEQRIAIAEACGWTEIGVIDYLCGIHPQMLNAKAYDGSPLTLPIWEIPDYLNDLNAMHEAEKVFADDDLFRGYEAQLDKVVPMSERWIFATAAQRAEAFLRTLNLWEE
jgi:hypothetical protein